MIQFKCLGQKKIKSIFWFKYSPKIHSTKYFLHIILFFYTSSALLKNIPTKILQILKDFLLFILHLFNNFRPKIRYYRLKNKDADLIARLLNPETKQEAYRYLVSEYSQRLYWQIRNLVKDHEDTDDILQNTFIKIYRNIANFKGESQLFSWMYRIATNEALTFLSQKSKRLQINSQELQKSLVENLESDIYFEGNEIQLTLQKAIARLPAKQQQVFNMKYFQELKYREIAEILETSEGALKASYHHAVKKIEEYLKNN